MISKSAQKKAQKQAAILEKKQAKVDEQKTEKIEKRGGLFSKTDKYGVAKEEWSLFDVGNKWIVVVGGVLLVGISIFDFIRSTQADAVDPLMLQRQIMSQRIARGETLYDNPQMSLFEKLFCRGAHTSQFCPEKPLHPILEASGTTEDRWEYLKEKKRALNGAPEAVSTRIVIN